MHTERCVIMFRPGKSEKEFLINLLNTFVIFHFWQIFRAFGSSGSNKITSLSFINTKIKPQIHTLIGYCWGEIQALIEYDLRFFPRNCMYQDGSISMRRPDQFRFCSKKIVFEDLSPSRAPHSTKKPSC